MARKLKTVGTSILIADNKSAAPAAPYDDDLVAIAGGGVAVSLGLVQVLHRSGTVSLTGPVQVIAEFPAVGTAPAKVVSLGVLNGGASIVVTADLGYQELVQGVGLCTKATLLPAGVTGGGAYDARYIPVDETA